MVLVQCLVDSASSEQCTADRNRAGLGKRAETASGKSSGVLFTPRGGVCRELEMWWEERILQIDYSKATNFLERQG